MVSLTASGGAMDESLGDFCVDAGGFEWQLDSRRQQHNRGRKGRRFMILR